MDDGNVTENTTTNSNPTTTTTSTRRRRSASRAAGPPAATETPSTAAGVAAGPVPTEEVGEPTPAPRPRRSRAKKAAPVAAQGDGADSATSARADIGQSESAPPRERAERDTPVPGPATAGASGPVVSAGGVLWVTREGLGESACASELSQLDPKTGRVVTSEKTGPAVVGPVVAAGTTMAFVTRAGCSETGNRQQLVVRDLTSATWGWTYSFPDGDHPGPTAPSIGNGKIYVASGNQVYAFDAAGCDAATCAPSWTTSLDLDGGRVDAGGSRPVVGPDGIVYVGALIWGDQTLVRALDGQTGAHLWRTDVHPGPGPGWQNLALAHGQLYVSDHRHGSPGNALEVFAAEGCDQPVCAPEWSASIDGPPVAGLTVGGDVLYVGVYGSTGSRMVGFDAHGCGSAICAQIGAVGFGDRQPVQVSVAGGRLAVVSAGTAGSSLRVLVPR